MNTISGVEPLGHREYVLAIKRDSRDSLRAKDWIDHIRDISGVEILNQGQQDREQSAIRLTIRASQSAVDEIRERFADICHIEESLPHSFQDTSVVDLGKQSFSGANPTI